MIKTDYTENRLARDKETVGPTIVLASWVEGNRG